MSEGTATGGGALAAVDLGTNSTRLLVADAGGRPLERLMTITRLGAGVDRTHRLADDAVVRTVATLRGYREVMDRHGVGRVRATATSAVRDAANRGDFEAAVAGAIGVVPEVISGDEEGRLSFAGSTAELDPGEGPWLMVDIGGGSTELAVGSAAPPDQQAAPPDQQPAREGQEDAAPDRQAERRLVPRAVKSLDVGCVRLTERFGLDRAATERQLEDAAATVNRLLDAATSELPQLRTARRMVGLAGTVSAAAALDLRLEHYDRSRVHHHVLRAATVAALLAEMAAMDAPGRRRRPGMEQARADVIVGGLVVLDTVLRSFGLDECLVSEADILDGMIMGMLAGPGSGATV